jgi:uncharacterized membrane protein
MAGIGFALRKTYDEHGALAPLVALGHATILASGPWIFAILSIGVVTAVTEPIAGAAALADFRVAIIYAFALSLLVSAPVCAVASRLVSDALHARDPGRLEPILAGALIVALAATVPIGLMVFQLGFGLTSGYGAAVLTCTTTASLIWVLVAFCSVLKDFRSVTRAFLAGQSVGALLCVAVSLSGHGAALSVHAMTGGLALTVLLLARQILRAIPPSPRPLSGLPALAAAGSRHWRLAAGALCAVAALWADKVVMWALRGEAAPSGLYHAPLYDSAMFFGCLIIIPAIGYFVTRIDTMIFERTRDYLAAILRHRTLAEIERNRTELEDVTVCAFNRVLTWQVGLCAAFVIVTPLLIEVASLQYRQTSIVRLAALGSSFQLVFLIASTIIIWFDRQRLFLGLQVAALVLNAVLTAGFAGLGERFAGMGLLTAFVLCGTISYLCALRTMGDLNYLVFVANNRQ